VTRGAQLKKVGDRKERAPSRPSTPPNHQRDYRDERRQQVLVGTVVLYSTVGYGRDEDTQRTNNDGAGRTRRRFGPPRIYANIQPGRLLSAILWYSTRECRSTPVHKRSVASVSLTSCVRRFLSVSNHPGSGYVSPPLTSREISTPAALPTYCPWLIYERRLALHTSRCLEHFLYERCRARQDSDNRNSTGMWRFHSHLFLIFQWSLLSL
jgi:hypothetical protein